MAYIGIKQVDLNGLVQAENFEKFQEHNPSWNFRVIHLEHILNRNGCEHIKEKPCVDVVIENLLQVGGDVFWLGDPCPHSEGDVDRKQNLANNK